MGLGVPDVIRVNYLITCFLEQRYLSSNCIIQLSLQSLSCQSDYHLLRKDLEALPNYNNAGEDGLLRIEIEELRYTMSATQRRLSRALAMKEEQCKQLQEVAVNQT